MTDANRKDLAEFEVRVDGLAMANASGPRVDAWNEAEKYFYDYINEGDVVELVEITVILTKEAHHD